MSGLENGEFIAYYQPKYSLNSECITSAEALVRWKKPDGEIIMEELAALVETAGGEAVAYVLQSRPTPDARTFLGEGKVEEMKELVWTHGCDFAVIDNEISPSQMRVLSEALGVRVLDRSGLILDIFAQRAQTREGQLQVELAQYEYLLPRLTGMYSEMMSASSG